MSEPEHIARLHQMARSALKGRRAPVAAELLEAYLQFRHDDGQAWYWFGNALQRVGRLEASTKAYNMARRYRPDDPFAIARQGVSFTEMGRHMEADQHFAAAVRMAPEVIWIWEAWAESLFRAGRYPDAREKLELASRLPSVQASTLVRLGDVLVALRDYLQAERAYNQALRLDPELSTAKEGVKSLHGMREALAKVTQILAQQE